MNMSLNVTDFTWDFLRAIVAWSILLGLAVAGIALYLGADRAFVLSFAAAALFDIGSLALLSRYGHKRLESGESSLAYFGGMTAGRAIGKAFLLLAAALIPAVDFFGTVIGVLLADTTILVVGSIAAAWKVMSGDDLAGHAR